MKKMFEKINLRVTHKLLFRSYIVKGVIALLCGVSILVAPTVTLGSSAYSVINQVLPFTISGALWSLSGFLLLFGIVSKYYWFSRIGLSLSATLYGVWCVGLLSNMLLDNNTETNFVFAVLTYASLTVTSFILLIEPPINPETAIKNKKE